ncbi:MAG: hypothetical protein JNM91_12300 [Flavobacteriales bacterium]|nr:hypothetical protein [Flavobacteriales bacterium]
MDKKTIHLILPGLAIGMSLIALSSNYDLSNVLGFVVSLLGLAGGAAYFLKNKYASTLLQVWIYAQIPAISKTTSEVLGNGSEMVTEQHYVDAGQALTFDVGLTLGTTSGDLDLKINVVPIGLLILFRLVMLQGLVGGIVTIKKFRQDTKLADVFPLSGSVLRPITLGKEKHWLLVELASPLAYTGRAYSHLLVKPKEDGIYKRGASAQVSYIVLVDDVSKLHEGVNKKEDFQFADWGLISIT